MSTTDYLSGFQTGINQSVTVYPGNTTIQQILAGVIPPLATAFFDGKRSSFNMKATDELLKGEVIDDGGRPDYEVLPDGWTGTVEVEKQDGRFAQLFAFLESNRYNGGTQLRFTIIETIRSPFPNGPTEKWQYTQVVFRGYDPGTYQKKQKVMARVEVAAQERLPV